jgi:glycosyltransferase involved in cell wall biosynthesis
VNVSFDIVGNRETVIPEFNAVLVPEKTPAALASTVIALFADRARLETIRARSRNVLDVCHSFDSRWPLVQTFLDL